jgi:hypothetical protein
MFDNLRRKLDGWLAGLQLGRRFVEYRRTLGHVVKKDEGVEAARAVLELVCEAREKWAGDDGLALRIAVQADCPLALFDPEFDQWEPAAIATHEYFKKACQHAIDVYHSQAIQQISDPAAIGDLNRAKESLAELLGRQSLQEYLQIRYGR